MGCLGSACSCCMLFTTTVPLDEACFDPERGGPKWRQRSLQCTAASSSTQKQSVEIQIQTILTAVMVFVLSVCHKVDNKRAFFNKYRLSS